MESWLLGRHQFPFPALKFRVLLAIWFLFFLTAQTQQFLEGTSGVLMRKPLTVHIYFLIIIPPSFFSTVNSFYLPPLIVVFGHMCLLVGLLFCKTKTEATPKEKEYEKVCERLFHHNNCWLRQKCLVSYSVLIDVAKSCICIWHQVVCIEDCRLPGWGEKEDP